MKILRSADHKCMPWKNGGGETVEIAIHPENASVDNFNWRISTATVADDGAFSIFPDIDRTLSVLEGNGIVLDIEGVKTTLTRDSTPFSFAADAISGARIINGAITDLNVMTRRERYTHHVERIAIDGSTIVTRDRGTTLVYCAEGQIETTVDSNKVTLCKHDCALLTDSSSVSLIFSGNGMLYLIFIRPL